MWNRVWVLVLFSVFVVMLLFPAYGPHPISPVAAAESDLMNTPPVHIGSRRELFVDNYIIGALSGTASRHLFEMTPATTDREDVAITWDADWEGSWTRFSRYLQDGNEVKVWYVGCHTDGNESHRVCYAVSEDGLSFEKPELGVYEWKGSTANNILFDRHTFRNAEDEWLDAIFAPFIDTNPATPASERYKGFSGQGEQAGRGNYIHVTGLYAFHSGDGINWKLVGDSPIVSDRYRMDSLNQGFWCEAHERYVVYLRHLRNPAGEEGYDAPDWRRDIMVAFSDDFVNWTEPEWLVYHRDDGQPGMELEELYTNEVQPYKRAPHLYFGFPARFLSDGSTEPMFMVSRDGVHFYRWMERPVISRSAPADRDKTRANHLWQEMVEIPGEPDTYSMYASENLGQRGHHPDGSFPRARRFTIRKDGFVSVRAKGGEGALVTQPLIFAGDSLEVNYDAVLGEGGFVRVELLDVEGEPFPGYAAADCDPLTGDEIAGKVSWNGAADVKALAGEVVHLRFVLNNADLFSFKFGE